MSGFGIDRSKANGHSSKCFECARVRSMESYRRNREARIRQAKDWKDRHPEQQKKYRRDHHLLSRYGIDQTGVDALLAAQGGTCAICREVPPEGRRVRWHVDHDHETDEVRGILCGPCNVLIGMAHEDPEVLSAAITYLSHSEKKVGDPT